jgi:formylglycine-generating enzyme required for sulfatase activity/dienelactone hydrolase
MTDMAHEVFISFSSIDKDAANAVCSILEENGIRCWIAPRDITPGLPFAEAIIDGIKSSKVFVLIYSSNSNHSPQVIKEVDRAVHHGLSIINLRLDDVPLSKQLEYYISDVHWLDASVPPLEQYIDKLYRVVQMILTMEEVDKADIEEAIKAETIEQEEPGKRVGRFKLRRLLIPAAAAILILIIFGAIRFFKRQADIRWARDEALPEIDQLIGENDVWRNLVEPYRLAEQAETILGNDPELEALFHQCSRHIDVITQPLGASVYMKEYVDTNAEWTFLGITPLDSIRVPVGIFRWKLEKEGYETVLAAASTWDVGGKNDILGTYNLVRTLDKKDSLPEGMVRIPATETMVGPLGDFFIGRYEVTNREYKEFVDAGGYGNREYWKNPFIKDGQEITWDEAMKEFVDQSGRPGSYTWMGGDYPQGEGDYPVSGVSWYEAAAYAEWKGMSLPTAAHWNVARGAFTPMLQWPQLGGFAVLAPFANFGGEGPVAVGSLPGITAYGAYDMAGNVREWCRNETGDGRIIRGGSWEDNTYEFGNIRQAPSMDRSSRNGIRLAFYPNPENIPDEAFAMLDLTVPIDVNAIQPVPDDIFQVYKEQFAYDMTDLNSRVEYREESPGGWTREKISFDAAYGGERVLAYLFLPENVSPSYQTVIYFPGAASIWTPSSDELENFYEFTMFLSYLIRNGRAVLYPVYKGTFERGEPALMAIAGGADNYAYTEYLIQVVKDFRRCIDYLETRPDIDSSKLAFYGMSWGGGLGSVIPAIEERLGTSILLAGGINLVGRPEVNGINYVTRVRIPTLMLNGQYDAGIDAIIRPMLDLLGTPPEDKRLILYETDHIPPRTEYIKETLAWLDTYLGPVR